MKTLAVIPARGNSRGIPKKNIRLLIDRPLLVYTIEAALKASSIDRVIVSTEDLKIADIAKRYGAEVPFLRPKSLAKDSVPTWPVIKHTIDYFEQKESWRPELIATLWPTTPFRKSAHIDEAMDILKKSRKADTIVGLVKIEDRHPFWMKKLRRTRVVPFLERAIHYVQRQELPTLYMMNGAFTIRKRYVFDWLKKGIKEYTKEYTIGYLMDSISSIDINTILDFYLAETLLKKGLLK